DLSPKWLALIDAIITFERRHGFPAEKSVRLPGAKARPNVVGAFLKSGHKWEKQMALGSDVDKFKASWWSWWRAQQPASRFRGTELVRSEDITWDGLEEKSGLNGLVLIVGTLLWWREAVANEKDLDVALAHADWEC
ncbi:hypothetical protein BDZ89DRAFT_929505, partial [Hymenopellis radicata]